MLSTELKQTINAAIANRKGMTRRIRLGERAVTATTPIVAWLACLTRPDMTLPAASAPSPATARPLSPRGDAALVWFRRDLRCHDHAALAATFEVVPSRP